MCVLVTLMCRKLRTAGAHVQFTDNCKEEAAAVLCCSQCAQCVWRNLIPACADSTFTIHLPVSPTKDARPLKPTDGRAKQTPRQHHHHQVLAAAAGPLPLPSHHPARCSRNWYGGMWLPHWQHTRCTSEVSMCHPIAPQKHSQKHFIMMVSFHHQHHRHHHYHVAPWQLQAARCEPCYNTPCTPHHHESL